MIELKTVIPILKEKYSFYHTLYNDVIGLKKKDDDGDDDDENDNNRLYHCDNNHLWITKDDNIRMKQKLSPKILEKTLLIEDMLRTSMIFKKIMQLHNNEQLLDDDDYDDDDDDDDKSHIDIDNQIQDKVNLNYDDDLIKSIQFNNNLIMIIKQIWKIYLSNLNQTHTNNNKKNRYEMIMINYKNIFDVINSSSDNDSGSIDDNNDDDDEYSYSDMVRMKNWKNLSKKEAQKTLSADDFKKWKKIMKQQKRKNNNDSDDDDNDD